MAIWRIFRRSPLSEEKYPNRNPAWKQSLLIIDFQGNTRKGSSTSLSEVTQYTYDLAGRQLSEDHPDRGLSTLTYDKASNVIEMTNPATDAQNDAIHLSYDYNRLRFKTMPAAGGAVDLYNVEYIYGHYGDGKNGAGRVVTIKQGGTFKVDDYKYDELGQMAQEVKTFDVPNVGPRTFATSYRYDSFGRILKSIYPDGDQVTYSYYPSGELSTVYSIAGGISQSIISEIYYDGRGNISALHYGNGTQTTYDYADRTWTLMGSTVKGTSGGTTNVSLMQRDYEYNSLGGISTLTRNMDASLVQGGETQQAFEFTYDSFNRLMDGTMNMTNVTGTAYQVETAFNDAGGILTKNSLANTGSLTLQTNASSLNYNLEYHYNAAKPHQLEAVVDQSSGDVQQFTYNESGSIKLIHDNTQDQEFYWNEEQWLNAVRNDKGIHHYVYDDKGERIMKSSVIQSNVYVNDQIVNTIQDLEPYTLYVNPYFVITEFSNADKVSKHYYMGTQRVASELAVQTTSYSPMKTNDGSSSSASSSTEAYKVQANSSSTLDSELEPQYLEQPSNPWLNNLNEALANFGEDQLTLEETQKDLPTIESIYPDLSPTTSYKTTTARVIYWYHPDYIGNVDLVSDNSGEAYEFFLYNPWGESLYEWNSGTASFSSPYRFNGKEFDQETGLNYYGARYYDNEISMWLSVDPMAMTGKNMTMSPYQFTDNNPVMLVDPNGLNAKPHEYDVDGTYLSDLGGDEVNFYHQEDGNTLVENTETCETQVIKGGVELIRDSERRGEDVTYETVYDEWNEGTGPTNSFFDPNHPGTQAVSESHSYMATLAREKAISGYKPKDRVSAGFGLAGLLRDGVFNWRGMIGSAGVSYYVVGDKVIFIVNDQKTRESFYYHLPWIDNVTRTPGQVTPEGNTYQTYLWIEPISVSKRMVEKSNDFYDGGS